MSLEGQFLRAGFLGRLYPLLITRCTSSLQLVLWSWSCCHILEDLCFKECKYHLQFPINGTFYNKALLTDPRSSGKWAHVQTSSVLLDFFSSVLSLVCLVNPKSGISNMLSQSLGIGIKAATWVLSFSSILQDNTSLSCKLPTFRVSLSQKIIVWKFRRVAQIPLFNGWHFALYNTSHNGVWGIIYL